MTRTLHADGTAGHAYIYNNGSAPSVYATPSVTQLGDLHFHSSLSYIGNSQVIEVTVNHPYRGVVSTTRSDKFSFNTTTTIYLNLGSSDYLLGSHSLGAAPAAIGVYSGSQMPAGFAVQTNNESVRAVSLYVTSSQVRLYEQFVTFDNALPAVTRTYKVYLFQNLFSPSGTVAISITPSTFNAGFNKLSTDYQYIKRDSASPDVYLTSQATADVSNGGLRLVPPGGTAVTTSSYNGAFTGSTGLGVKI